MRVSPKTWLMSGLFSALWLSVAIFGQTPLSNDAVLKMVKAGLADDVIINMIGSQPSHFTVAPDDLINLKSQGVSDKVIGAMVTKNSTPASPGAAAPAPAAAANGAPTEMGVYYNKKGAWVELTSEIVN